MKDEVLLKIHNEDLEKYYFSFPEKTGLSIVFERLTNRVRAEYFYRNNTSDFVIRLAHNWREVDLAHELMHGNVMFIKNYGMILCDEGKCRLLRAYLEDIIVHEEILNNFGIIPYDESFVAMIKNLTGNKISDSYWDPQGKICEQLHKALLYVQVWHFNRLENKSYFDDFLEGFRTVYSTKKEINLADEIICTIEHNNSLNTKENYDKALQEVIGIPYLQMPKRQIIFHYEKKVGYVIK
jgi:hypothetical protein